MVLEKPAGPVEALVLCIDRDDDLGRKAGIRGPIVGEDANFRAARALALADPEDSDTNAIFAAVKTKRESEHLYKGVEVITLTGDKDVGVKSDQKIGNQLVRILEAYNPKGVILVSDGAEDNEIMPLLLSETKVLSVKTIAVKTSQPLESAYFKIQDFFGRIAENPRQARLLFGLPGLLIFAVVLLSYLGIPIVELILGMIGVYLLAKGFGYDEQLFSGLGEVKGSLIEGGNIYKVFNIIAMAVLVMGLMMGYVYMQDHLSDILRPGSLANPSSVADAFVSQPVMSLNFMLFAPTNIFLSMILAAGSLAAIGFAIHGFITKNYLKVKRYFYILVAAILVSYLSTPMYWFIINVNSEATIRGTPEGMEPLQELLMSILTTFVILLVVHYLMKIIFFDYISRKKQLEGKYLGKEVLSNEGKKLGEVTRVSMRGNELKGINIKKKYYPAESIHAKGKLLFVGE
jgi:uncharacterized membrane protein